MNPPCGHKPVTAVAAKNRTEIRWRDEEHVRRARRVRPGWTNEVPVAHALDREDRKPRQGYGNDAYKHGSL
ncbi:MAG: hypothetical protein ACK56F_03820, partial [bacterium]